jgi:hypothetical protein
MIGMILNFNEQIDEDLIIFLVFFIVTLGHFAAYFKKFLSGTKSMLTNETFNERQLGYRLHYKMKKQPSMMERMQGIVPELINPFDKVSLNKSFLT